MMKKNREIFTIMNSNLKISNRTFMSVKQEKLLECKMSVLVMEMKRF